MRPFMREFAYEFMVGVKEGPRLYFAPIVGAFRAVKQELDRISAAFNSRAYSRDSETMPQPKRQQMDILILLIVVGLISAYCRGVVSRA